jgi:hypothetical protein
MNLSEMTVSDLMNLEIAVQFEVFRRFWWILAAVILISIIMMRPFNKKKW